MTDTTTTKPRLVGQATTGTTHYARGFRNRTTGQVHLTQACGMARSQRYYLARVPNDTPVTCRRCNAS